MFIRVLIFFFGLCVLSLGISTVTNAGLGTGTVSSVAYVLNELCGLSIGFFVFLTNVFFFVLQIIVDPEKVFVKALKQLPICFVFGVIFDIAMEITAQITTDSYFEQVLMACIGSVVTGLGIASMVFARLAILPPEGLCLSIMKRWGGSFGNLRMGVDVFLVLATVVISWFSLGTIIGLREGTIITACCSGQVSKLFLILWHHFFPEHSPID